MMWQGGPEPSMAPTRCDPPLVRSKRCLDWPIGTWSVGTLAPLPARSFTVRCMNPGHTSQTRDNRPSQETCERYWNRPPGFTQQLMEKGENRDWSLGRVGSVPVCKVCKFFAKFSKTFLQILHWEHAALSYDMIYNDKVCKKKICKLYYYKLNTLNWCCVALPGPDMMAPYGRHVVWACLVQVLSQAAIVTPGPENRQSGFAAWLRQRDARLFRLSIIRWDPAHNSLIPHVGSSSEELKMEDEKSLTHLWRWLGSDRLDWYQWRSYM